MSLRDRIDGITDASGRFDQITELGNIGGGVPFNELPEEERLRRGEQIAEHWEAIADECEQHRTTAFLFSAWTPEQMRAEAAVWRTGQDPR